MYALLDALVQTEVFVPGEEVEPFLEGDLLEPAIVLLCRDVELHQRFLVQAFRKATGETWRACGNLLADARNPAFVLEVLRTSVLLTVLVAEPGVEPPIRAYPGSERPAFGVRHEFPKQTPYPPSVRYAFLQVAEAGTFALHRSSSTFVRRTESHVVPTNSPDLLVGKWRGRSRTRLTHWLARMLGPDADPAFYDFVQTCGCEWSGPEAFLAAVQEKKAELEQAHRALITQCVARKLVTAEAAATLTPIVDVRVEDHRQDARLPLPRVR